MKNVEVLFLDKNECISSHNCTGYNEICENTIGSFKCLCASGYERDVHNNCISKQMNFEKRKIFYVFHS
jgi:hypothetical protein